MRTMRAYSAVDIQTDQKLPRRGSFRQRRYDEQVIDIFLNATIADIGKVKDAFDDEKSMFDLGAHTRLSPVLLPPTYRLAPC